MKKNEIKTDVVLKEFWRSNEHFADLFNAVIFGGEQKLKPEMLREMDSEVSGNVRVGRHEGSLIRMRDIVKKMAYGVEFVILGIENQQHIHYAMPLRMLFYDGMSYLKEYQTIADQRSKDKEGRGATQDEFLSKMRKEDRLHPVISVVIYYNEEEWDGPLDLRGMMTDMPKGMEAYFSNYSMNLVQVVKSDGYSFENEDVRTVFEWTREIFRGNFAYLQEQYGKRNIKSELVSVIGKITNSEYLMQQSKTEEEINMCTALENLERRGREEGRQEGRQDRDRELVIGWSKKGFSVLQISELLGLTEAEIGEIQDSDN